MRNKTTESELEKEGNDAISTNMAANSLTVIVDKYKGWRYLLVHEFFIRIVSRLCKRQ